MSSKKNIRVEIGSEAYSIKKSCVFQKLVEEELQENDLLRVTKINRSSRSTLESLKLQDKLFKQFPTFLLLLQLLKNERRKKRQR